MGRVGLVSHLSSRWTKLARAGEESKSRGERRRRRRFIITTVMTPAMKATPIMPTEIPIAAVLGPLLVSEVLLSPLRESCELLGLLGSNEVPEGLFPPPLPPLPLDVVGAGLAGSEVG